MRTKVPADDAVPGGVVLLVKLLLYVRGDVLLDVELLQRLRAGRVRSTLPRISLPVLIGPREPLRCPTASQLTLHRHNTTHLAVCTEPEWHNLSHPGSYPPPCPHF